MRQNSAVKNMQRTPHVHRFTKNIVVNGRDKCDTCPYREPRPIRKTLGTKREAYDFEKKFLLTASLPTLTVPKLREMLLKRNPNAKNVSKMKKADLVTVLAGLINDN